jgi:hypothetical protein
MNNFLFLSVTPNVGVDVNGTFLDSVGKLFSMFGVIEILASATFLVILYVGVKYINFKMSDIVKDKNEQIDKLTERLIENGKEGVIKDEPLTNPTSYRKHITEYKELFSHPLFYSIDYMISVKLSQTNVTSKIKKEIFKDYIEIKYSTTKKGWLNFLSNPNLSTMNADELRNRITQIFIDVNIEMESKTKSLNIPELALDELNKSFQLVDSFLFSSIEVLTESNVFDDNVEVIYTILDLTLKSMEVGFHSVIINLEKLNGQLDKLGYKNIKGV